MAVQRDGALEETPPRAAEVSWRGRIRGWRRGRSRGRGRWRRRRRSEVRAHGVTPSCSSSSLKRLNINPSSGVVLGPGVLGGSVWEGQNVCHVAHLQA
jgi:hypothetical protein